MRECQNCGKSLGSRWHGSGNQKVKWCSDVCRKRAWNKKRLTRANCADCGKPIGQSKRCLDCHRAWEKAAIEEKRARVKSLYDDGLRLKEIAEIVGTSPGSISVFIAHAKLAGWPFPPRRKGWKGHTKPTGAPRKPAENRQQAYARLHHEVKMGRIVRPDSCEGCGAETVSLDGHHTDYDKPLEVEWLCRTCHLSRHGKRRLVNA